MRSRFACLVLGVLLVPGAAFADSHNWDVQGGFSGGGGGSTLNGFIVALGKSQRQPEPTPDEPTPRFKRVLAGIVGNASVQGGKRDDGTASVTQVIWSGGARFTFEKSRESKNSYHAQVTAGQVLTNGGQLDKNFATVIGAAWDHVFGPHHDGHTPHPGLGMRFQADRVFSVGEYKGIDSGDNFWRLSASLIYRIPKL